MRYDDGDNSPNGLRQEKARFEKELQERGFCLSFVTNDEEDHLIINPQTRC
jgi:predicted HTH domain antitoxin